MSGYSPNVTCEAFKFKMRSKLFEMEIYRPEEAEGKGED